MGKLRFVWGALFVFQLFLLGALLADIMPVQTKPMPAYAPALSGVFALGAVIYAFAFAPRVFVEALRGLDVTATDAIPRAADVLVQPFARTWTLANAISIFGFYLGVQRVPRSMWLSFFAVSLVLALVQFPRLRTIETLVERAKVKP